MDTRRFGRKIKLPATIAIKHQVRNRRCGQEGRGGSKSWSNSRTTARWNTTTRAFGMRR